jgi:hypothetical protein
MFKVKSLPAFRQVQSTGFKESNIYSSIVLKVIGIIPSISSPFLM